MDEQSNTSEGEKFAAEHRWDLAEFYLKRSEKAANFLRALLFALSAGAIGFIAKEKWIYREQYLHAFAIILFALAIATIVYSWVVQKGKAIERFKTFRDKGAKEYLQLERCYEKVKRNYVIDGFAMGFIGLGFVIEFLAIIEDF